MDQMGGEMMITREMGMTNPLPLAMINMLGPKELLVITTKQMVTRVSRGKLPEMKVVVIEAPTWVEITAIAMMEMAEAVEM